MESLGKNARMMLVWETMQRLGRATPADVFVKIANASQASADDPNLKRNVYRDLKDLADRGKLTAKYFGADGEELAGDDERSAKNVRVEYIVAGAFGSEETQSYKILGEGAVELFSGPRNLKWKASELNPNSDLDSGVVLLFPGRGGTILFLKLTADELPCKLVITRKPETDQETENYLKRLPEVFGQRVSVLFISNASVSRPKQDQRFGHAVLSFLPNGSIRAKDLGSTSGTSWQDFDQRALENLVLSTSQSATLAVTENPFSDLKASTDVKAEDTQISSQCKFAAGSFIIIVKNFENGTAG